MAYLVIDLEMTGTEPGWHEIIEIGAILLNDQWQTLGEYRSYIYPENEDSFSTSAEEIHGISMEELDNAPMLHEVLPEFENWIIGLLAPRRVEEREREGYLRQVIMCGQSVINDINFLRFAYRQEKLKWCFSNTLLDLHTLSYFLFEILQREGVAVPKSRSLKAIAAFFGLAREGEHHTAIEDAQLTAQCFIKAQEYLRAMHWTP